jgi:hypothetical protein
MKDFFKPNVLKIVLTLILFLFGFAAYLILPSWLGPLGQLDSERLGLPFRFFTLGGCEDISPFIETRDPGPHIVCQDTVFKTMPFILDLLFWYLCASIISKIFAQEKKI